jgi:hypothetical protein
MTISQLKPTVPGWYWVKCTTYIPLRGQTMILKFESMQLSKGDTSIQPVSGGLSTEGWDEFSGPIPEPTQAP